MFYHDIFIPANQVAVETGGNIHYGVSDSSLLFRWRNTAERFPNAKWVVIQRDFGDCLRSCQKVHPEISRPGLLTMQIALEELVATLKPMVVNFDEIDPIKCYEIAAYLDIDIGPATRVRQLCDMNIQIHPPILQKRLASLMQKEAA